MTSKNSVLILTSHYFPNVGGVETHLSDLTKALVKRKWKVVVATYKPLARRIKTKTYEVNGGLKIYRMPWPGFNFVYKLWRYPFLEFIYLFPGLFIIAGVALVLNREISVIHAQGLAPAVVGLLWAKATRRKVIMSTHNLYFFPKDGMYVNFSRFVLSRLSVLALSDQSAQEIKDIGVPYERVSRYRYWLDLNMFKPIKKEKARKVLNIKGKFVCFFVGRMIETKGVLVLLGAAKKTKDITFIFAGLGPLSSDVERAVEKNKNIFYVGPISSDLVRNYMSAADVVAVPSLVDEGYGRVAMEALATGTPVLAAKKGGLSEVVTSEVGLLIKPTSEEYIKYLKYLSNHPKELIRLASKTRSYARRKFSEKNVEDIISQYKIK